MTYLYNANIKFDKVLFQREYFSLLENEKGYSDHTGGVDWWRVIRHQDMTSELCSRFAEKIKDAFNIEGRVDSRFYRLVAENELPWHQDRGTQCSFNFVLSGDSACKFKATEDDDFQHRFLYSQSLFNTQAWHSVEASDTDRILYKVSIFDETFNSVKKKVENFRVRNGITDEIDLDKEYELDPSL